MSVSVGGLASHTEFRTGPDSTAWRPPAITKCPSAGMKRVPGKKKYVPASTQHSPASSKQLPASSKQLPASTQHVPCSANQAPCIAKRPPAGRDRPPGCRQRVPTSAPRVPRARHRASSHTLGVSDAALRVSFDWNTLTRSTRRVAGRRSSGISSVHSAPPSAVSSPTCPRSPRSAWRRPARHSTRASGASLGSRPNRTPAVCTRWGSAAERSGARSPTWSSRTTRRSISGAPPSLKSGGVQERSDDTRWYGGPIPRETVVIRHSRRACRESSCRSPAPPW